MTPGNPGAPNLVWPPNGSTSQGTSLTLQWTPVSGASQYLVYFGASSINLPLYATLNAPAVSVAVYNLSGGTAYFWKVVAIVGANSVSGGIWSFTTPGGSQTLSAPNVVWPVNDGLATSLTAQWSPVVGATQYQIYFGSSPSSLALYATVHAPTVTEAFRNLTSGTTYYWQVVPVAAGQLQPGQSGPSRLNKDLRDPARDPEAVHRLQRENFQDQDIERALQESGGEY